MINTNFDFLTGLSATLLEKESELSKIQKELKVLEPYKVGRFKSAIPGLFLTALDSLLDTTARPGAGDSAPRGGA